MSRGESALPLCPNCGRPRLPRMASRECGAAGPPAGPPAARFAEGGLARNTPEPVRSMLQQAEKWEAGVSEIQRAGAMARDLAANPVAFAIKYGLEHLLR